ncbi:hypothetical protein OSB04_007579 [Centaurea solstitialis]|uniref:ENTH domain-containing protein n=1 Tax=Centaurea solstitialis TaxID=347529 RepID=A0AA38TLV3_9ASTR|nr:hypothetical protein OSB04_007579 [Centaurea solstitialis]
MYKGKYAFYFLVLGPAIWASSCAGKDQVKLALTDVNSAQLLVEESTNGNPINPCAPDARTLKMIPKAAYEIDDYWRIANVLHNRLVRFDAKNWRISYKAVVALEHLLTYGPESVAEEFQIHKDFPKRRELKSKEIKQRNLRVWEL